MNCLNFYSNPIDFTFILNDFKSFDLKTFRLFSPIFVKNL